MDSITGSALVGPTFPPLQTIADGATDTLVAFAVGFLIGLYLIVRGARAFQRAKLIANTPPERVRSIAVGRTEVHGHTRVADDVLCEPFGDDLCLYREWKVQEYKQTGDDDEKKWTTVDSGSEAVPFYVADDTGEILIEPNAETDFEISSANSDRTELSKGARLPAEVRSFYGDDTPDPDDVAAIADYVVGDLNADVAGGERAVAVAADAGEGGTAMRQSRGADDLLSRFLRRSDPPARVGSTGSEREPSSRYRRRFIQEVLPIDEEVYVFGGATARDGAAGSNAERLKIETDESSGLFIVSDRDESGITKYYGRRGPLYVLGGLALSAACLYVILHDYVFL